jgi:hypothetical protein
MLHVDTAVEAKAVAELATKRPNMAVEMSGPRWVPRSLMTRYRSIRPPVISAARV